MSKKEEEILERMAKALPAMSEMKKGEFLGYAKAMVDLKKQDRPEGQQAEEDQIKEKGA